MILALAIAILAAGGVYLTLQRGMVRIVLGVSLITHAANLTLLISGVGAWRSEPLNGRGDPSTMADPLPQAFVLTAIVISLAVTVYMLMLAVVGRNDDTLVDPDPTEPGDHDQ